MTDWHRRRQRLLEVGCGAGRFLETFRQAGFDVTGVEASPDLLAKARRRLGSRADLRVGRAECLDFDDRAFDYVVVRTLAGFCPDPQRLLREAGRVARKGLIVGLFNSGSLFGAAVRLRRDRTESVEILRRSQIRGWPQLSRCIKRTLAVDALRGASVLPGPACTWQSPYWRRVNIRTYPPRWGAYCAARADLARERTGTPLMAWTIEPSASCCASRLLRIPPRC
jgi:SAM-dependent methyltransferase